jgi:hypothetical protein
VMIAGLKAHFIPLLIYSNHVSCGYAATVSLSSKEGEAIARSKLYVAPLLRLSARRGKKGLRTESKG